nr:glycosyltransferase [uncultured Methylophaga sp.]
MSLSNIGAVIIGRNEGERLIRCIKSLQKDIANIIYVDSGSTDGSVQAAMDLRVTTIELDLQKPFTAARARNEGARVLITAHPEIEYIQFVDGDCEVISGWIQRAHTFLQSSPHYAIACGRRRERFPEYSVYNQLCDIEWNTPVGDANACGGDTLIRLSAFQSVNGYSDFLIAGEEPEMCFRMRQQGWKIMRLDADMTLHDAAMTKFTQWWKRHKRAGHAYAESYYLHGQSQERFRFKEVRSNVFWSLILPMLLILSLLQPLMLWLLLVYPLQIMRLTVRDAKKYFPLSMSLIVASSNVLSKFPQTLGIMTFYKNFLTGKRQKIIEYK